MSLYSDALKTIRRHKLLEDVRTVVVGLSGGPDSVCLLDLLALMAERGELSVRIHAAHLNHGLRGAESDEDERFARELAERMGLPITVERRDVGTAGGGSIEEAARRERYSFLAAVARDVGAEAVAVAHNADDQIETVLHRLIRGAGLKGLRGMSPARPLERGSAVRLIRPLLRARRSRILEYLRGRGLSFREDSSNRDNKFLRNRIRNELLPLLEADYNPALGESVLRLSRSVSDAHSLLAEMADAGAAACVANGAINIDGFRETHDALKPLVIDSAVASAAPGAPQLGATHYEAVIELALDGEPGGRVDLPGGITAERSRETVVFARAQPRSRAPDVEVALEAPGETTVGALGITVRAELADRSEFDLDAFLSCKTCYDEALDFDAIAGPLVLRSRRDGDRFRPLGVGGGKKVGDFLTDLKVPAAERDRVLVVAAGDQPVWVVGYRIDERAKVTPRTKRVIRLSVNKGRGPDGCERS